MKTNRQRGATLGLVAFAVIVIVVLGACFFVLSQILGGGREVANATDAGALNVARKALSPTVIKVALPADPNNFASASDPPYNDFLGSAINGANGIANTSTSDTADNAISMLAVNRILAQSVLVALNAQYINTSEATSHANAVATAAKNVSRSLTALVQGSMASSAQGPSLFSGFNRVSQSNNTKMFQGNKVQLTGLQSAFLRTGQSTNVYVSPNLTAVMDIPFPANFKNSNPNAISHDGMAGTNQYMAGYTTFSVNAIDIAGVPIFPKQKPHLVDTGEFNAAAGPINDYLPPNAFRANTQTASNNLNLADNSTASGFGGAVSCALVGALDQDFPVSIPRGYIRIKNGIDARDNPVTAGIITSPVVDGTTDVFNNELWAPNGGVDITNNGVFALRTLPEPPPGGTPGPSNPDFASAQNYINSWQAYNSGSGGTTPPAFPPSCASSLWVVQSQSPGYHQATVIDMQGIGSQSNCTQDNYFQSGPCRSSGSGMQVDGSLVAAIQNIQGIQPTENDTPGNASFGYSAIEVQKQELLSHRLSSGSGYCSSISPIIGNPGQPFGMKLFTIGQCYNTPTERVNFGAIGNPMQLLDQIGGNGQSDCEGNVITRIANRMRQVDPQITEAGVRTALTAFPLPLGSSLYIYSPGPGLVAMVPGSSADYFNSTIALDGANSHTSDALKTCTSTYNLQNKVVDAAHSAGCPIGDADFHERPYLDYTGTPVNGVDKAVWTPASGWRNLLGEVNFQNEATGAGTFCKPN